VVGTGVGAPAHATLQSIALMRRAERLFYLVTDRFTEGWLKHLNRNAETLADLYGETIPRHQTYRAMTARITAAVRDGYQVCAAFYGHPGVFVESSHESVEILQKEGFSARMLPGISADACLYADLGVDPGICGVQSFEATDFLRFRRLFDPTSILLLWQVGVLGVATASRAPCRPDRLAALVSRLRRNYPARHPVVLYRAGQRPGQPPSTTVAFLAKLATVAVTPLDTLYVPPLKQRRPSRIVDRWFEDDGSSRPPGRTAVIGRRRRQTLGTRK
jgi:uroporphyrin-III C-methyltransferase